MKLKQERLNFMQVNTARYARKMDAIRWLINQKLAIFALLFTPIALEPHIKTLSIYEFQSNNSELSSIMQRGKDQLLIKCQ